MKQAWREADAKAAEAKKVLKSLKSESKPKPAQVAPAVEPPAPTSTVPVLALDDARDGSDDETPEPIDDESAEPHVSCRCLNLLFPGCVGYRRVSKVSVYGSVCCACA